MLNEEVFKNVLLMTMCYIYISSIIFVSGKMEKFLKISQKASRKFLHAMIGNLTFIIPFFTSNIHPTLVAATFIIVTFLASPRSPFKGLGVRLKGLSDITEEGHHLGLVFYAISYTLLALLLASKPHVIAVGILPMAYGDSAASMVGERFGRRRYRFGADKSLEGSAAMFFTSFFSVTLSLIFFSTLYPLSIREKILPTLAATMTATLVEGLSPRGSDNLTVPISSALAFLFAGGGV